VDGLMPAANFPAYSALECEALGHFASDTLRAGELPAGMGDRWPDRIRPKNGIMPGRC